ncbi:MAG TPA: CPBP family intramembrane glutamic endopeptidase [Gaiellaceae bacterium]|nr:CPBP family intramembrane glutamic endopeptidase [Gaiellaceae bacterium]
MIGLERSRLAGWVVLVSVLALLGYASRAASGKPPQDAAYLYSTAISGIVQYGIILAVVLAIARPDWQLLALRRPSSYGRIAGPALLFVISVTVVSAIVSAYSDPGREQGLIPKEWDSSRAIPFVVNFVVFTIIAPFVEEVTFRGLGYSLLAPLGALTACLWVGLAFGLAHGLVEGLPVLIVFGAALAFLRSRVDSVYPGMVLHGAFNAIALIASVTT